MRLPRWSPNTWVLATVLLVLIAISGEWVYRQATAKPPAAKADENEFIDMARPPFPPDTVVPDWELPMADGKKVHLHGQTSPHTVLLSSCGCDRCTHVTQKLVAFYQKLGDKAPSTIGIFTPSYSPEGEPGFRKRSGATFPFVYSRANPGLLRMWNGEPCPRLYVLDNEHRLKYVSPSVHNSPTDQQILLDVAKTIGAPKNSVPKAKAMMITSMGVVPVDRSAAPKKEAHDAHDGHDHSTH